MTLGNKVVLITGGSEGIGKAAALRLAQAGAHVALLGRNPEKIAEAVAEVRQQGHEALELIADVGDEQQVQAAIQATLDQWGRLDVVFANAGMNGVWAPLEELTLDEWNRTLHTNLTGTFLTVKYAIPALKKQGGSIIITSSVNGTRIFSNAGATAYSCSKAGQVAFAKMMALELARDRIRVNVICPGAIDTGIHDKTEKRNVEDVKIPVEYPEGQIPLTHGEQGRPEDVADLVLFLASDASRHITGTEIWIDGAQSLL